MAGEPTSHGLLSLASKYPDLYAKAMRRNGGNFKEVVKEERAKAAPATATLKASTKGLGLDDLKERYPELYKEAMTRNGGNLKEAEEEEKKSVQVARKRRACCAMSGTDFSSLCCSQEKAKAQHKVAPLPSHSHPLPSHSPCDVPS